MAAPLSRRAFVRGIGIGGVLIAAPELWLQPAVAGSPDPEQIHLQFGGDASGEVVVSWATPAQVRQPRLRLGTDRSLGRTAPAETRTYVDAQSGLEIFTHHARLNGLQANTSYTYEVFHDGSNAVRGAFTTAPRGRAPLRFTSFGDQQRRSRATGWPRFGRVTTPRRSSG